MFTTYLDMLGSLQQTLIQRPCVFSFSLSDLEIYVGLPQQLGHVEHRLLNRELVQRTRTLGFIERGLEFGKLAPGCTVGRVVQQELFIQRAAPVCCADGSDTPGCFPV